MTLLLVALPALGYELSGSRWADEDLPIELAWNGAVPGLAEAETAAAVEGAAAAWSAVTCQPARILPVYDPGARPDDTDGVPTLHVDDPGDDLDDGVLWIVAVSTSGGTVRHDGASYGALSDVTVVLNDGQAWATDDAIDAGDCTDERSLQGALTKVLGQALGLSSLAGEGEATMAWRGASCDTSASSLAADDVSGLRALYGHALLPACAPTYDEPMGATCSAGAVDGLPHTPPTWEFGDGTTGEGDEVEHTWLSAGEWVVTVCTTYDDCETPQCTSTAVYTLDSGTLTGDPDTVSRGASPDRVRGGQTDRGSALATHPCLPATRTPIRAATRTPSLATTGCPPGGGQTDPPTPPTRWPRPASGAAGCGRTRPRG